MLGTSPLVAFVLCTDSARAKSFYGETLGLRCMGEDEYAVVYDAHGTMLRATIMPEHKPSSNPVIGWTVSDLSEVVNGLIEKGINFERYPFIEQDKHGVWTSADGKLKIAWFKDLDGNLLSVAQAESS